MESVGKAISVVAGLVMFVSGLLWLALCIVNGGYWYEYIFSILFILISPMPIISAYGPQTKIVGESKVAEKEIVIIVTEIAPGKFTITVNSGMSFEMKRSICEDVKKWLEKDDDYYLAVAANANVRFVREPLKE